MVYIYSGCYDTEDFPFPFVYCMPVLTLFASLFLKYQVFNIFKTWSNLAESSYCAYCHYFFFFLPWPQGWSLLKWFCRRQITSPNQCLKLSCFEKDDIFLSSMGTEICLKLFMYSVWLVLDKEKLGQSILRLLVDLWKRKKSHGNLWEPHRKDL